MSTVTSLQSWLALQARRAVLRPVAASRLAPERIFAPRPMAMYVHVPFCGATCAYCCFNTDRRPMAQIEAYLHAVEQEALTYAARPELGIVEVSSLYIGGGTPSYVPAELLGSLLGTIRRQYRLRSDLQITLEANPESIQPAKLQAYRTLGINRISLGVQSFNEQHLRRLGRRHDTALIRLALRHIREAGIEEINVDLMYGLPGQTLSEFAADLRHAISTCASHIALFPLSYQPGTPLWSARRERRPLRRMYEHAMTELSAEGFRQYTTEDFTRSQPCHYNVDLWQPPPTDCLGLGAGALSTFGGTNWHNLGDIDQYIAATQAGKAPVAGGGTASTRQQMIDHLLVATKTLELDRRRFEERFGVKLEAAIGPIPLAVRALGLARRCADGNLELTHRGRYLATRVWSEYILGKLAQAASDGTG